MTSPKQTKSFDPTKPVQTLDGKKARIIATNLKRVDGYSIAAAITDRNGNECLYSYAQSGALRIDSQSQHDLINIPTKREGWIAVEFFDTVLRGEPIGSASLIYATQDEANDASARVFSTRSQIIRIVEEP